MKTIHYKGKEVPIRKLATILGLERPTLARRVREYEAGRLTLEDVLSKKQLPPTSPQKKPIDVPRLRVLLRVSEGDYPPVAEALGVTRAWVHQMVVRSDLLNFARELREKAAAEKREKRRLAKPPKAAPFHVDTERLRSLLEQSGGQITQVAKTLAVPYSSAHRAVERAGLLGFARSLRAAKTTPVPAA